MSGLIVGLVLRLPITKQFNSEAKFIATVYADHAWEDGSHAYPAVSTVAKITGLSERTVQRYLRMLETTLLTVDGKGPRGTNKYKFTLCKHEDGSIGLVVLGGVTQSPPVKEADSGDSLTPRQADGGDTESGDRDSGDTSDTRINNPSFNLVVNEHVANVSKLFEQEIGALTPLIADAIRDACNTYDPTWIPEAIAIAVNNNSRNWKYVLAILKNCKVAGKRPSLNRLDAKERKNGATYRRVSTNSKNAKGLSQANITQQRPSAADIRAAEKVKQRQQANV